MTTPEGEGGAITPQLEELGVLHELRMLGVDLAHDFAFYSQAKRGDLSVTDRVPREELTLPLWS
jgi:hypothetical protein